MINSVEFHKNDCSSFTTLREDFCDVTLSGEDEQSIEAHKIILSASSSVFRTILKNSKHPHPYINMMDVMEKTLAQLVKMIYQGEIKLDKKDLDGFIALAEDLQVTTLSHIEPENKLQEVPEVAKKYEPNTKHTENIESSKSMTRQNIGMEFGEIIKETNTYSKPSDSASIQLVENKVEVLNMHKNSHLSSPNRDSPIHLEPETEGKNKSMPLPELYLSFQETRRFMTNDKPTTDQIKQTESLFFRFAKI